MLCVKCGHEISTEHTINFCPNCGQPIKEENKIARYTTDGKPISQPKSQEGIPSKAPTTDSKINTETPKAKGIADL